MNMPLHFCFEFCSHGCFQFERGWNLSWVGLTSTFRHQNLLSYPSGPQLDSCAHRKRQTGFLSPVSLTCRIAMQRLLLTSWFFDQNSFVASFLAGPSLRPEWIDSWSQFHLGNPETKFCLEPLGALWYWCHSALWSVPFISRILVSLGMLWNRKLRVVTLWQSPIDLQ